MRTKQVMLKMPRYGPIIIVSSIKLMTDRKIMFSYVRSVTFPCRHGPGAPPPILLRTFKHFLSTDLFSFILSYSMQSRPRFQTLQFLLRDFGTFETDLDEEAENGWVNYVNEWVETKHLLAIITHALKGHWLIKWQCHNVDDNIDFLPLA